MFKIVKNSKLIPRNCHSLTKRTIILGIESSCDDSGAALISHDGKLLGECLSTQLSTRYGGVIPSFAMGFHAIALPKVVEQTFQMANVERKDIDAIAITNRPGLSGSLSTGVQYAQYLSRTLDKPLIPIHHMEAHALTARMVHKVEFPFMVLLVSGGHCLLAVAQDINKFLLLGSSRDSSPGEALDKIARRLKLHTIRNDLRDVSGGKAIEKIAQEGEGDPLSFKFPNPLSGERNCRFSFTGLRTNVLRTIDRIEKEQKLQPDQLIPQVADFCASVEYAICLHICRRLQRGFVFADLDDMWGSNCKQLVVSGGVACNNRIKASIKKVCDAFDVDLIAPAPKYCTDNGVMVAWNGIEKWRKNFDIVPPSQVFGPMLNVDPRADFGIDISKSVEEYNLKCSWIKLP